MHSMLKPRAPIWSSAAASWPGLWRAVNSRASRWPSPVITGGCGGPLDHDEPRGVVAVSVHALGQNIQPIQFGSLGTGNGGHGGVVQLGHMCLAASAVLIQLWTWQSHAAAQNTLLWANACGWLMTVLTHLLSFAPFTPSRSCRMGMSLHVGQQ